MTIQLKNFMTFKLNQQLRITGRDLKATKEEIASIVKNNMSDWCKEAVAAGAA